MKIKHKFLARLGIWCTAYYDEHGELSDWEMKQTPIRKFLNWLWEKWNTWRHGDPYGKGFYGGKNDGELPNYMYQTEFYK